MGNQKKKNYSRQKLLPSHFRCLAGRASLPLFTLSYLYTPERERERQRNREIERQRERETSQEWVIQFKKEVSVPFLGWTHPLFIMPSGYFIFWTSTNSQYLVIPAQPRTWMPFFLCERTGASGSEFCIPISSGPWISKQAECTSRGSG